MKIIVIGGTGLIGSQVVRNLGDAGHDAIPASPNSGVDTLTGEGLAEVLEGAEVVVDVSNSPSFEDAAVLAFFETATRNILDGMATAGARHLVALSVVGSEGLPGSGYLRAKVAQERRITTSSIPHSIVRATQFFEFLPRIAEEATIGGMVRLPPVRFRPGAAGDVAAAVSAVAVGAPLDRTLEVAGPDEFRFDELVQRDLRARGDGRIVIADPRARYFGTELEDCSLVPGEGAQLLETRYEDWLVRSGVGSGRRSS